MISLKVFPGDLSILVVLISCDDFDSLEDSYSSNLVGEKDLKDKRELELPMWPEEEAVFPDFELVWFKFDFDKSLGRFTGLLIIDGLSFLGFFADLRTYFELFPFVAFLIFCAFII